jgi:gliding motility-associated-like protein
MRNNTTRFKKALALTVIGLFTTIGGKAWAQCPEITIDEKYDHQRSAICVENGWDTTVDCRNASLVLHVTYFITAEKFNGTYLVEEIPYNPVDTTFHAGSQLNINNDDQWEATMIQFPFTFMFFGYPYTQANVGSNGLVTFNTNCLGQGCNYIFNEPIPNPNFTQNTTTYPACMNAIYGVYEDIDPRGLTTGQGMYRYVGGTYPCRHLCASVNEVPLFPYSSNSSNRCTYQIVCYEGTNVIEVHVKQRSCCSSTNGGKGMIGIQNATGLNQVSHYHDFNYVGDPTYNIEPNSPGAFVAPNRGNQTGGWTGTTSYEAWRFTPQGSTSKNIFWWRLFEDADGNIIDSVQLTNNPGDTNGYYLNAEHTMVRVTPTRTTRYVVQCRYKGANGHWYGVDNLSMRDTITVGMDTGRTISLWAEDTILAEGERTRVYLQYPNDQVLDSCTWLAKKRYNGRDTLMPPSALTNYYTNVVFNNDTDMLVQNHTDSSYVFCNASFKNGCNNYDSVLIQTFPNYDFYDTIGLCRGESADWCGMHFAQPQHTFDTSKHYYSVHESDSVRHLHLVVSDLSYHTDTVLDCKPYTWQNGRTYSANNDATRATDTVHLKNDWGCDSIVTLDFTIIPMKAIIEHTPEVATIDNLTIELYDRSYGHDSRKWLLPDGQTSLMAETSIIFPLDGEDSMTVQLAVHNNYGCDDTATSVIPLHKVSYYVPNVFTPDRNDNNRWAPSIQGNANEIQVWIYNRRGAQVCYFQGSEGFWDGTDMYGRRCEQGSYVYIIRYRNTLNPEITQEVKGTITLLR